MPVDPVCATPAPLQCSIVVPVIATGEPWFDATCATSRDGLVAPA